MEREERCSSRQEGWRSSWVKVGPVLTLWCNQNSYRIAQKGISGLFPAQGLGYSHLLLRFPKTRQQIKAPGTCTNSCIGSLDFLHLRASPSAGNPITNHSAQLTGTQRIGTYGVHPMSAETAQSSI